MPRNPAQSRHCFAFLGQARFEYDLPWNRMTLCLPRAAGGQGVQHRLSLNQRHRHVRPADSSEGADIPAAGNRRQRSAQEVRQLTLSGTDDSWVWSSMAARSLLSVQCRPRQPPVYKRPVQSV